MGRDGRQLGAHDAEAQHSKVKRRIRKGIPDSMRAAVWPRFTGAWALMHAVPPPGATGAAANVGPGVYARYAGMYSKEQDTIQRDIARTFPNHVLFRDTNPDADEAGVGANIHGGGAGQGKAKGEDLEGKNSSGRSALYNVLKAYSLHDEQVGYCQVRAHQQRDTVTDARSIAIDLAMRPCVGEGRWRVVAMAAAFAIDVHRLIICVRSLCLSSLLRCLFSLRPGHGLPRGPVPDVHERGGVLLDASLHRSRRALPAQRTLVSGLPAVFLSISALLRKH